MSLSLALGALALSGCGSRRTPPPGRYPSPAFVHRWNDSDWGIVLSRVVTEDGLVRYELLKNDSDGVRDALSRYIGLISRASPANRPDLFPAETDKLAYYLNAYNALALDAALRAELPQNIYLSGILRSNYVMLGRRSVTLEELENRIIRRFGDPRVHFAINWMSRSCPPLRREPYAGPRLDQQLDEQGATFLSDPRAVQPLEGDSIRLSELLTRFYPQDFLDAFERRTGEKPPGIIEALAPYAAPDAAIQSAREFETLPFDWSLNRGR